MGVFFDYGPLRTHVDCKISERSQNFDASQDDSAML